MDYEAYQKKQFLRFEGICKHCGECCGSRDGDSCANLATDTATGKCFCMNYENRLGPQKTLSGKAFNCVTIREIAKHGHLRPNCAYNNK